MTSEQFLWTLAGATQTEFGLVHSAVPTMEVLAKNSYLVISR